MKANITIKYLDLSWNGFCDDGAMAMGLALKANNTLMWLDLSHNRISDKGFIINKFSTFQQKIIVIYKIAYFYLQGVDAASNFAYL